MKKYLNMRLARLALVVGVIAALPFLCVSTQAAAPAPGSLKLYVFDCGTIEGPDPARYRLKPEEVAQLMDEAKGGNHMVTVDLDAQTVLSPSGQTFRFEIDPVRKAKMLKGLDSIGETLQAAGDIDVYEMKRALAQPWLEEA